MQPRPSPPMRSAMPRMLPSLRIFLVLLLTWSPQMGAAVKIAYDDCVALSAAFRTSLSLPNCSRPAVVCEVCDEWLVEVNKLYHITKLFMSTNNLSGTLPAQWSELKALDTLYMSSNNLSGTLPAQWSELKALTSLDMAFNSLSGTLPAQWSELKALATWDMSDNNLSCAFPAQWSELKALTYLDVSSNNLSGTLPVQWRELKALAILTMRDNRLSGTLPAQWSELKALYELDMRDNMLSGTLPAQWNELKALATLNMRNNSLSCTLPAQWSEMKSLADLDISQNRLSGTLPAQWSELNALTSLFMHDNGLSSTLPAQWSELKALAYLYMSSTNLSGTLPAQWSELKSLATLFMPYNMLGGTLPAQWSELKALTGLYMSGNNLSGTLPAQWSKLKTLDALDISSNSLSGTLPAQWSELKALADLSMSDNNLSGRLPPGWSNLKAYMSLSCPVLNEVVMESWKPIVSRLAGLSVKYVNGTLPMRLSELTNLQYLNMTQSNLHGPLPLWVSKLTALRILDLSHNHFTGALPLEWAKLRSLYVLAASNNSINGTMPAAWNKLASLYSLDLSNNRLTGTMPAVWNKLIGLTTLDLSNNHLTGTLPYEWSSVLSSLPSQFDDFLRLTILKLASNNIRGPIPAAWLTNRTWSNTLVYIDVSKNQLTGILPQLSDNIQFFNASSNSFTGPLPPIPPSLVYLHVGGNKLSGTIPNITDNSKLTFMDISSNEFTALPAVFQAPRAIFLNASENHMQGPLPSHGYNHSLVYCDLSRNQLSGFVPDSWHNHTWSYLALDNNHLSGNLPSWSGHVEILLLQRNYFSGCVMPDASQLRGTKVLSISSHNITCLTANWSTTLTNLSLLDVSGTSARLVPLEWVEQNAFAKEQTVLRMGRLWKSSARHSQKWRCSVCIRKDLNDKLSRSLNYTTLPQGIQDQIQNQINLGLAELTRSLHELNVTGIMFDIGPLQLRLDNNLPDLTRDDICGNDFTQLIVIIQYSVLFTGMVAMGILYWVESRWHLLSGRSRRGTSCLALDSQRRHAAKAVYALSIVRSGKFLVSLLLYWFDVISDIVLITQVWQFSRAWPGYVLLGILLVHYAVALFLLTWRAQITTLSKILVLVFGMPLVPFLDTIMFVFLVVGRCLPTHRSSIFASVVMLQWETMFEMREVLEVCIEAVPTSVFQSTIFLLGNRPDLGWFLDTRVYIVSAVASSAQIMRMVGFMLWESTRDDVAPWTTFRHKLAQKSNSQSKNGQHVALSASSSIVSAQTGPELQQPSQQWTNVALNTTSNTAEGQTILSPTDIHQGLEQL